MLAHYHNIPFYVAAPSSTFDLAIKSGAEIPIEERAGQRDYSWLWTADGPHKRLRVQPSL